jgi:ketosteroid isomerase-like protein
MAETGTDSAAAAREYFAALNAGDGATMQRLLADDLEWTVWGTMPISGTTRSRDELFANAAAHPAFEPGSVRMEVTSVVADGDRAVVEARCTGRTIRDEPYANDYAFVLELRDGAIAVVREYMDTDYARRTLFPGDDA